MSTQREETVRQVLSSKNYRHILPETVERIVDEESKKGRTGGELTKAVKAVLHRDWGVFAGSSAKARLDTAAMGDDARAAVTAALQSHVSTAPRLAVMDEFWAAVFAACPAPASVWDCACGLNPLCLPFWPALPARYLAWDIDGKAVGLAQDYFAALGRPYEAVCADALTFVPPGDADLLLLFEILPVAERQQKGSALRLLSLPARHFAVTLPTRSVGGRRAGIAAFNEELMDSWAAQSGLAVISKQIIGTEWLYLLRRQDHQKGESDYATGSTCFYRA
ncbi:MAG: hypothetical protein PHD32_03040 [Eubacteriales bacterium]|nr:hypothetical protein [Eubacteriales bacterium]